ncbi:MAG: hypothetical protein ABFD04_00605 [Syntrophomonas sp.]
MNIQEKIDFINEELRQGKSLKAIAEELNIGYSTIKERLSKAGYRRVDGIYILVDSTKEQDDTISAFSPAVQYRKMQDNTNEIQNVVSEDNTQLLPDEVIKDILRRLVVLEERVSQNNTKYSSMVVNLPDNKEKMMSSRVNEKIYSQWQEFCKNQKYLAKDLLSMALLEYMLKYE